MAPKQLGPPGGGSSRGKRMAMMAQSANAVKKSPAAKRPSAAADAHPREPPKKPRPADPGDDLLAPAPKQQQQQQQQQHTGSSDHPQVDLTPLPPRQERSSATLEALQTTPFLRPQRYGGPAYSHSLQRQNATVTQFKEPRPQQAQQQAGVALARSVPAAPVNHFFARRQYGRGTGVARGAVGMVNLGNTCYLNAVLQVLLSLPQFVVDLQAAFLAEGKKLPAGGVAAAVMEGVSAKDSSSRGELERFRPASLKKAMGARMAAFEGAFQQDAHEFFCGLLDVLQSEVLGVEAARLGRPLVRISETADPAARNFSFAVCHELTCSQCGRHSSVTEEFLHLSLELPEGGAIVAPDVSSLLKAYFADESVEKRCEGCGAEQAEHQVQHRIKRLPRVLALHMKRFQITLGPSGTPCCQKLHRPVQISEIVRLGSHMTKDTQPPLPDCMPEEGAAGKENRGGAANAAQRAQRGGEEAGRRGAPGWGLRAAAVTEAGAVPRLSPAHSLPERRSGAAFFSDGSSAAPEGAGLGCSTHSPRRRLSTPPAPGLPRTLRPAKGLEGAGGDEACDFGLLLALQESMKGVDRASEGADGHGGYGSGTASDRQAGGGGASQEERDLQLAMQRSLRDMEGRGAQGWQQQPQQQQQAAHPNSLLWQQRLCEVEGRPPQHQQHQQPQQQQQLQQDSPCGILSAASPQLMDTDLPPPRVLCLFDEAGPRQEQPARTEEGGSDSSSPRGQAESMDVQFAEQQQAPQPQQHQLAPRSMARIVEDDADMGAAGAACNAPAQQHAARRPLGLYTLHAIINHSGSSAVCGHFTADIQGPGGRWRRHNDSLVTDIDAKQACGPSSQRESYMLFYVFKE